MGWQVVHADYREFDVLGLAGCVQPRCQHLLQLAANTSGPLLLAGSSMGAFVSGRVSLQVPCVGLFLLATPVLGYEHPLDVADVPLTLVHGFVDDVCPFEPVVAFARQRGARVLLVDDGHRLANHVDWVTAQFGLYLQGLACEDMRSA